MVFVIDFATRNKTVIFDNLRTVDGKRIELPVSDTIKMSNIEQVGGYAAKSADYFRRVLAADDPEEVVFR